MTNLTAKQRSRELLIAYLDYCFNQCITVTDHRSIDAFLSTLKDTEEGEAERAIATGFLYWASYNKWKMEVMHGEVIYIKDGNDKSMKFPDELYNLFKSETENSRNGN